jgi:hypothetical protein
MVDERLICTFSMHLLYLSSQIPLNGEMNTVTDRNIAFMLPLSILTC